MSALDAGEILQAACCLVALDDKITAAELQAIMKLADAAGIGRATVDLFLSQSQADRNYYKRPFQFLKPDAEPTLVQLTKIAMADGELSQPERIILQYFAKKLGMDEKRFAKLIAKAQKVLAARA